VVRVLSTGIDTLQLAVKGTVRREVWDMLAQAQQRTRMEEDSWPVEFPVTEQAFLVKPHGLRGHT
jgi:hypothetical protein